MNPMTILALVFAIIISVVWSYGWEQTVIMFLTFHILNISYNLDKLSQSKDSDKAVK